MRVSDKFDFKKFTVYHDRASMKVGTDGVLLGAWTDVTHAKRILDVGTGSGVIALMLAQRINEKTQIDAIDISLNDCDQARENIAQSPWPTKISVHHTPLQLFESDQYDLIVSNPPYFINSYKPPTSDRTNARHTDTLSHYELLLHAKRMLNPVGSLAVVLPLTEANQFQEIAQHNGWHATRKCTFQSKIRKPIERILLEFQLVERPLHEESLVLYDENGDWSAAYRNLTKDFYLNL
jgi:tRNA1Val (adenine37-N6)-methyltransferase